MSKHHKWVPGTITGGNRLIEPDRLGVVISNTGVPGEQRHLPHLCLGNDDLVKGISRPVVAESFGNDLRERQFAAGKTDLLLQSVDDNLTGLGCPLQLVEVLELEL